MVFSLYVSLVLVYMYVSYQKIDLGNEILFWWMRRGFTSLEKRAFYILPTRISVHRVPTAGEEAVGFQFCRKANIVARPSESKTLLLSRDAYCTVRKVKRI